jgi:hypothetical protein
MPRATRLPDPVRAKTLIATNADEKLALPEMLVKLVKYGPCPRPQE